MLLLWGDAFIPNSNSVHTHTPKNTEITYFKGCQVCICLLAEMKIIKSISKMDLNIYIFKYMCVYICIYTHTHM